MLMRRALHGVDACHDGLTPMRVELAMVTGDDKGDVFAIRGPLLDDDPVMLLGLPGTLIVTDGVPRLEVDR